MITNEDHFMEAKVYIALNYEMRFMRINTHSLKTL